MEADMTSWYLKVFQELLQNDVRFVIVGGIAVNLLGVPRSTADLDLVVALDKENVVKFGQCMTRLGFKPRVPVKAEEFADPEKRRMWIEEKNMRVFSFHKPDSLMEVVDVFVREPMPFDLMWNARETVQLGDIAVPVSSIDHLIELKKEAARLQDVSDIDALNRLKEELASDTK